MPIYEFYCPDNHRIYSFLAPSISFRNKKPRCPDNPDFPLEKRVSQFAIGGQNPEDSDGEDPFAGMDEEKLASMMEDMDGELSDLDESNPDPRRLGKAMRKMMGMMGSEMGGTMEEMVTRLERGEDPQALEEEFGDAIDSDGEEVFDIGDALKKIRGLSNIRPSRDPKIYDMKEFLR